MAPFDRILISAGAPRVPAFLEEQLRVGGHAVVPVGESESQVLTKVTRTADGPAVEALCACSFVPLIGREGWSPPEAP